MNEHKEFALRALQNMKGDDLYRAQAAFKGKDLTEQHGMSGKTRFEILKEYSDHEKKIQAAIEWLMSL